MFFFKDINKVSTKISDESKLIPIKKYDLRNANELGLSNGFNLNNHFGEVTLTFFFTKLTNNLFLKDCCFK